MTWTLKTNIKGPTGPTGATGGFVACDPSTVGSNWTPSVYRPGYYFYCNSATNGLQTALPNGVIEVSPWVVTASITVITLFVEIQVAGNTSSVFRIGVWNDTGYGQPGTLLLDAGTVAADSTGVKTITVSLALTPGVYWAGGAAQNAATTAPQAYCLTPHQGIQQFVLPLGTSLPAAGLTALAVSGGSASGAFSAITTPTPSAVCPRIGFQVHT